ncbi:hypothetical protein AVEN_35992-1 [Araneus ventricosus]|uniref:Uncharacterized protein n=1 Tax=Araneus ventricosus TaxID=182803 RepID=A0A4Y2VUR8_ARAVE|nr:hypothetical protein AVEN_35992-1 [Araneus ventricosus]
MINCFSVIRPPAGQISQPQSRAFLHGVDWKRSTLDRRSLSATRGWPTQTVPYSLPGPSRLAECRVVLLPTSFLLRCFGDFTVWSLCRGKEVGETSQYGAVTFTVGKNSNRPSYLAFSPILWNTC